MKKYYVYELINLMGSVEYVGRTKNPKNRLYQHTKFKPSKTNKGLFYGRQDIIMNIVKEFDNVTEASQLEGKLKLSYDMRYSEADIARLNGKIKSKPVFVYKTDGTFVAEYDSQVECGKAFNVYTSIINKICKGERTQLDGYIIKNKM